MKTYLTLFYILILAASCHQKKLEETFIIPREIPVSIEQIRRDTVSPVIHVSGFFTTEDETLLSFKNGGIIDRIFVREGDIVRKGQLLATVIGEEVNTGLLQAQTGLEKAQRDYDRVTALYRDSVATQEQWQNAATALELARQQWELAQTSAGHSSIYALEKGYVLKRYLNEGQLAGPGVPVLLVNGADNGKWMFQVSVSESQWIAIQEGDLAEITSDVAVGTSLRARVVQKSKSVDPMTGGLTVKLAVEKSNKPPLATGVFGQAKIHTAHKMTGWSIPYSALLDGDSEYGFVFVTNDQKFARKVKVHISHLTADRVWIDHGLDSSHLLIVAGSAYLKDGSAISLNHQND